MILGIDATNIRHGGGVTHLVALLRAVTPESEGFTRVIVWAGKETLRAIEDRPWLVKSHSPTLDRGLLYRALWQRFALSRAARASGCDALFVPGGTFAGRFRPVVTLSQNLLPFETRERQRYGLSWLGLKFALLRIAQGRTFQRADGVLFLTAHARDTISHVLGRMAGRTTVVPHGIDERFFREPRPQIAIDRCSRERPFRLVYVSMIDVYKHQWRVAEAVSALRAAGLPVILDLIGPAYPPSLKRLQKTLKALGGDADGVRYLGPVPHGELHEYYAAADLCVFASSCENLPITLLEAMACGLPIVCSDRGPMPEVLGDAGVFCNPESAPDIERALRLMIESPELRQKTAADAIARARSFSWLRCADDTFGFISAVTRGRA
jgi:glycosyltransferase involved in cell wall biosynthesis